MTLLLILVCFEIALYATMALLIIVLTDDQTATGSARLAEIAVVSEDEEKQVGFRSVLSYVNGTLASLRRPLNLKGSEDLAYRLSVAGYREPEDVDTFLNAKLLGPVVGILIATFTGPSNIVFASLLLGAGGFFAPDLFLNWATNKRKRAVSLALPNGLDLLAISMEAGLGIDQAVVRVAKEFEFVAPQLSEELLILSREQRAGKPRTEAWRSLADRVDLDTVRQFAGMLTQAERLGTPIARSLAQFADALRTKRLMEAEERAAKTTVKLIFPLVFFIFPAMFIVILGPAVISISKMFDEMSR